MTTATIVQWIRSRRACVIGSDLRFGGMIMTLRPTQPLRQIATSPTFRTIEEVSIRFVESARQGVDALLLSPWPESVFAYEASWSQLAERAHLVAIDLPGFGR